MTKKIFLLSLALVLSLGVFSQVRVNRDYGTENTSRNESRFEKKHESTLAIKYGVKAGLNMSTMSNDMSFDPNFSMGMGFRVGALVNLHWGKRTANSLNGTGLWGLQPEIVYSNQVVKSDGGDIKMNYIQVPIMLKVYPTSALSFEVGPEFSYLLSTSPDTMAADGAEMKIGDCKGLIMGAGVGAAYELDFGLVVGARYSLGLTDLAKNLKWKNSGNIQVTVGWLF